MNIARSHPRTPYYIASRVLGVFSQWTENEIKNWERARMQLMKQRQGIIRTFAESYELTRPIARPSTLRRTSALSPRARFGRLNKAFNLPDPCSEVLNTGDEGGERTTRE